MELSKDLLSRQQVRELVVKAHLAQEKLARMSQEEIDRIVKTVANAGMAHSEELAHLAAEETGFGNEKDKITKNRFAAETVWNAVKDLKTVGILREDREKRVWDIGVPVGVVAAIAPSTNPTSTVIYKTIITLKGGNAIIFSPHPGAKNCTEKAVEYLRSAAAAAGCPPDAIGCITIPTMDAVQELMRHPKVKLILATGGGAMVKSAYSSGKPAIGVGAGNGPAYLHPSCDLNKAVERIFFSKTFDNGTICASEQSIIYEKSTKDAVLAAIGRCGGYVLTEEESKKLSAFILRPNGTMNPKIVGKTAKVIAELAGLGAEAQKARVLLARESEVGVGHPFSGEKLCPILALYEVEDETAALALSCAILHHEGSGHTFSIHAEDEAVVRRFAKEIPVSRFLVNTPAALGGIGATTNLFPALTLGCGAVGGSSSSNNIGPLDLINIRRVAWGVRTLQEETTVKSATVPAVDEALLAAITARLMEKLN